MLPHITTIIMTTDAWQTLEMISSSNDEKLWTLLQTWHCVTMPSNDNFNEKLVWCLENCRGKFRDMPVFEDRKWFFEQPQDAAMFALKWA